MGIGSQLADLLEAPGKPVEYLPHQVPPPEGWTGWLLLMGRGSGKSHGVTGYLREAVIRNPKLRARIIAPTLADAIEADVYGPCGIMEKDERVEFRPSAPGGAKLVWPTGAECLLLGVPTRKEVDRLRATGNRELDLFEEGAAIPVLEQAWEQAELGRRLGRPRWVMATTPRSKKLLRTLQHEPGVVVSRGTPHMNPYNDKLWLEQLEKKYRGTRLYRQEVLGEILEDVVGALWRQARLDDTRVGESELPELKKKVVGVDPASGSGTTGIVVVGLGIDGHLYVLEDLSEIGRSAEDWARVAAQAAVRHGCVIVAENDMGGDMVRATLKAAGHDVVVKPARARNVGSKEARATPISMLWERDEPEAHLVGDLPFLEEELTTWVPNESDSPDRLDALVWACLHLHAGAAWEDTSINFGTRVRRPHAGAGLVRFGR